MAGEGAKVSPWGAIATGVSTLLNLGLGIADRIKANKLQKQWNTLNAQRPTYEIPQAFSESLDLYRKRAAQTQRPGQELIEENIQQSSARARTAAERGAPSATSFAAEADIINAREMEAIQDLGIQSAQFQWANQGQLAQGLQAYGQEQEKAQDWNVTGKWAQLMQQKESQMGARTQNANTYLSNAGAGLINFAGTSYYAEMLKNMNKG